jgi:hypothetical protein
MEARHLVFIGYSLPQADFEFRQLLSRMVHRDATIEAVLFEGSSPDDLKRYSDETERYQQFFGTRRSDRWPVQTERAQFSSRSAGTDSNDETARN